MPHELTALNAIRLEENLSVPQLARLIGVERSTLHRALKTPGRKPYDRTLHKIREFLDARQRRLARRRRRPAGRARSKEA